MIYYFEGTVFNSEAQAIVNTINCKGFMGAGLALEFKLRYPEMYKDYKNRCEKGEIKTGKVFYYEAQDGKMIINFPTKNDFRYPSKMKWIEEGLEDFARTYEEKRIQSVAFPLLGASQGGLNQEKVIELMRKKLDEIDIKVQICLDQKEEAEGIEGEMVDDINKISIEILEEIIGLSQKQRDNICSNRPYKRFREIKKVESIGEKTYGKLFRYFFEKKNDKGKPRQLNLFDH